MEVAIWATRKRRFSMFWQPVRNLRLPARRGPGAHRRCRSSASWPAGEHAAALMTRTRQCHIAGQPGAGGDRGAAGRGGPSPPCTE